MFNLFKRSSTKNRNSHVVKKQAHANNQHKPVSNLKKPIPFNSAAQKNKEPEKPIKYYLIDYENVSNHGLDGIEDASAQDIIHIFYTHASNTLTFDTLNKLLNSKAKVIYEKVDNGIKNALDFQLSSYLGYLIRENKGKKISYFIISKDNGYIPLTKFWSKRGVNISILNGLDSKEYNSIKPTTKPIDYSALAEKLKKKVANEKELEIVFSVIKSSKSKSEIHNKLEKIFASDDNKKASDIYKVIKSFLNF